MISQVGSGLEVLRNHAANIELHTKTENLLKQITEKSNWTLENGKLANWQIKSIYLGAAGTMGLAAALIPPIFSYLNGTPSPYSSSCAILGSGICMMNALSSTGEDRRVTHLSNQLKEIVAVYKQDMDSPSSKAIVKKLEKIIKTANAYTESRSYSECCLVATLIGTGFVGIAAENSYLPERLKTIALVGGLAKTAALSFFHHMYKSQDLQKVSQNVNECLKILEKQKEQTTV